MNNQNFALITGATSGIGYELAQLFAQDHINLILVARNEDNLKQTKSDLEKHGVTVHIVAADLFKPGAAEEVYNKVSELSVTIEYLVNDAGQGEWGRFHTTDLKRELDIIQLNIVALVSLTKFYLKEMVARNSGRILQLASSVSKAPTPYLSVYAASKAFVLSFSEALSHELEETKVTVTALLPGATDTDFFHKAKAENTVTYKETDLYSPADVAKGGYDGMMNGDMRVEPGFMNKFQNSLNAIMPDGAVTSNMEKQMVSSMDENGREAITHAASARERESINASTGGINGDTAHHAHN